ncbi:MAG: 1-acyl-sn-glycerol-3-phosphate acyltransferase [Propionibacteriaceae bacterium]|jgi:1-acyl-sn-glycerol-3-phosphate acyltransferase|nr:1-acyl-sn-glycerol-3-phosphate acyltransferase [Propionibacteriaceae bacterium]
MFYTLFKYLLFTPILRTVLRGRITGQQNIPAHGGIILAGNHVAAADAYVMPALIHRQVLYPAKAELFRGDRGLGSKVVAWFLKVINQVPLDRADPRNRLAALAPILARLKDGGAVAIFPEGTRSPDGRLYKGKTGIARLALAAHVPVVPFACFRTQKVKGPLGLPWLDRPLIVVGEPISFEEYAAGVEDHDTLRWVTDEVMAAIQRLSGQEYVDVYGSSVKSGAVTKQGADEKVLPRPGGGPAPQLPGQG